MVCSRQSLIVLTSRSRHLDVVRSRRGPQGVAHDLLGLAHYGIEMSLLFEGFCIKLGDFLRAGGTGCEPTASGHDFQAAVWGAIANGWG